MTADLAALPRNVKSDFETSVKTSSSRLVEDVKNAPTGKSKLVSWLVS